MHGASFFEKLEVLYQKSPTIIWNINPLANQFTVCFGQDQINVGSMKGVQTMSKSLALPNLWGLDLVSIVYGSDDNGMSLDMTDTP